MGASASNAGFDDCGATDIAGLAFSVEDLGEFGQIVAFGAVGFAVIFDSRAARVETGGEAGANRGE